MVPWCAEGLKKDESYRKPLRRQHQERIGFVAPKLNQASALYMELLKEEAAIVAEKAVSLDCTRPCLSQKAKMSYFKNFMKCKLIDSLFLELLQLNNWGEGKLWFLLTPN